MELNGKEDNESLAKILPTIKEGFDILSSTSFKEYEGKLDKVTGKAISSLEGIIDDGSLAMDPEQLVRAVDALTKAKMGIVDSRRKLLETLIKGEVMLKALEPPKDKSGNSALDEFLAKQKNLNLANLANANSVFVDIDKAK